MRIAVWHNLPNGNGAKRALDYHVGGLVERGHHVEVWRPNCADPISLPHSAVLAEHTIPLDWPAKSRKGGWRQPYSEMVRKLRAIENHCRICADEINARCFDVLFANTCMYFRTTPIGRYVDLPRVLYLQDPYRWLYEALPTLPWLAIREPTRVWWSPRYLRWYLRDLVRVQALRVQAREELHNAQGFDRILVNSLYSRESVMRAYGIDAVPCYLGIDTDVFHTGDNKREPYILSVGAIVPEKGVDFIIRAVAEMCPPRPPLVWVATICPERYLAEYRDLADSLGVDFRPRIGITDSELISLYRTAAVLAYAPRLEPFGLVPLEANACGLPVVAVPEGGVRETVQDGQNGLLVGHDPKDFAKALERLLSDRSYAEALGLAGRRLVEERWSLEASIDRLEQQLADVAGLPVPVNASLRPEAHE